MSGMRCAQLVEIEKPLVVSDQPIPIPPPKGLIVRTAYAGICHSDIHAQDDKIALGGENVFNFTSLPNFKLPMVLGHEIAGVIHSLGTEPGKGSPQIKVGDRVLIYPWIGCHKDDCGFCEHGAGNLCPGNANSIGLVAHGGFSTHVSVLDRKYVIKVPDNIPMDVASMLPCSGLTAFSALKAGQPIIEQMTKYKGGVSVLVIGAGGLGMWYLRLARAILPSTTRFIVAGVTKEKLERLKGNGADRTVLWDNQDEETLIEKTKQEGINNWIDVTVDFVNSSVTGRRANNCLNKGGVMICVGLFGGGLGISLPVLALQQRSILGCCVGGLTDLQELVNLLADKKIQPPSVETINIDGVNNALDRLRQGKINGRCLIKYT